jgi:uncharacterized protein YabE (DUF348 family)
VRRSLQLSLFAVVLLGLVGGSLAFFLAQKSVKLTVDGELRTVGTYASTVGDVLDEEGLEPAAHDVVLPAADQKISDGDAVVLSRARPLELTVDGVSREVYVTALSVDEALDQLGFRAQGLVLSASRSERLPLDGMQLTITTPRTSCSSPMGRSGWFPRPPPPPATCWPSRASRSVRPTGPASTRSRPCSAACGCRSSGSRSRRSA